MAGDRGGEQTKVFISYSSKDRTFAERLAADFKRHGIDVWYDGWEMKVGDSLTRKIHEGIRESSYLAIVLSPDSVSSRWVRVELEAAINREIQTDSVFVLPILYQKCDLPVFLTHKVYADFTSDYNKGFEQLLFALGKSAASATGDQKELVGKITLGLMVDKVDQLTALELSTLVKLLEQKFGVTAAVPVSAPVESSGFSSDDVGEEVLAFLLDGQKIPAIKRYREITRCGLKEAKDAVERLQEKLGLTPARPSNPEDTVQH